MKRGIKDYLDECPKHDCAYILINSRWHKVEEHQVRWIQRGVALGEIDYTQVRIKDSLGKELKIMENGLFENLTDSNIFRQNGEYHRVILIQQNKKSTK